MSGLDLCQTNTLDVNLLPWGQFSHLRYCLRVLCQWVRSACQWEFQGQWGSEGWECVRSTFCYIIPSANVRNRSRKPRMAVPIPKDPMFANITNIRQCQRFLLTFAFIGQCRLVFLTFGNLVFRQVPLFPTMYNGPSHSKIKTDM